MSKKQKDGQQEKKRSGFICQVKYRNTLPDVPLEPKFLPYPFDTQRFGAYDGPTGLERSYKYELLAEHDLGVNIDLINPDACQANEHENVAMDPIDERLLEILASHSVKARKSFITTGTRGRMSFRTGSGSTDRWRTPRRRLTRSTRFLCKKL